MGFSSEKRNKIKFYLMEKLREDPETAVKKTSDTFLVSRSSIYRYIRELENEEILIRKGNRLELKKSVKIIPVAFNENTSEDNIYNMYIKDIFAERDENVRQIWEYAFLEMMNNALEHAGAKNIVIGIIRDYMSTTILIHDDGIGIFKNIMEYFNLETLNDAANELFKGKLTTDKENHSGEGIFFTSKVMDRFCAVSDGMAFTYDKLFDFSGDIKEISKNNNMEKGTTVCMELSNFSNKSLKEIFDMFSDEEGVFNKTIIPLRHIFERDPMARSQARNLCSRLDSFEEAVLDFKGIEFMGQGFAHEIFAVYKKKHPKLKITVLNASRDVEKMINHVSAQ